jgi:uncharacterized membrane protein YccC
MEKQPGPSTAFWQLLVRMEQDAATPWLALRNSIGVSLPLIAGASMGFLASSLPMCTGAMIVSFSDSSDPYYLRARRMLAASVLVACSVFIGAWLGSHFTFAVILAAGWAFAAGMLISLSPEAGDLGVVGLVILVVFFATPLPIEKAFYAGLLAFAGGLLQMALSLSPWPLRRFEPERRILRELYLELSTTAATPATGVVDASAAPPASARITQAQIALAPLVRARSVEAERHLSLLNQAERMRLSLLTLRRLRARMRRESPLDPVPPLLDRYFGIYCIMLQSIADSLQNMRPPAEASTGLLQLEELSEELRAGKGMAVDARIEMDALTGQMRAAADLASSATPSGETAFLKREAQRPWNLRLIGVFATLRANVSLRSAICRHAIRLSVCIAIAEAAGRGFNLSRAYWLPMTVAIVLKPDFATTFTRGVLRLAGTLAGLAAATLLYYVLPMPVPAQIALVGLSMFAMRRFGPANYGIFVAGVSSLIVFLFALSGFHPKDVVAARAGNTLLGGAIALAAYWLWPTWERTQSPELLAQLLDGYRVYFRVVRERFLQPDGVAAADLNEPRLASRLARSNLQASMDKLIAEPGASSRSLAALNSILAASHRLAHALMALEASLYSGSQAVQREPFIAFANDVESTLFYLSGVLRGSTITAMKFPDLREAHRALRYPAHPSAGLSQLVIVETDRITNSLNTIASGVFNWVEQAPLR